MKVDASGNLLWYRQWAGDGAFGIVFTHDAAHLNDIVVAGKVMVSGIEVPEISLYDNSGTLIKTARYSYTSSLDVVDMLEITLANYVGSEYVILCNATISSTLYPAYVEFDYGLSTASMHYITTGLPYPAAVTMCGYNSTYPNNCFYILGGTDKPGNGVRPYILKVQPQSPATVSGYVYTSGLFGSSDDVVPGGITYTNAAGPIVSVTHNNSSTSITEPGVFATDAYMAPLGNLDIHLAAPTLPGVSYKDINTTYDHSRFIVSGNVGANLVLSRVMADGEVGCDQNYTWTTNTISPSLSSGGVAITNSYNPSSLSPAVNGYSLALTKICKGVPFTGCDNPTAKITYSRVINSTFKTNDFMQADYYTGNNDLLMPSTHMVSGGEKIYHNIFHYDGTVTNAWDHTFLNSEEALAIKKAKNGDMIIAGRSADPVLFLMRTDASGNILWFHAYPQTYVPEDGYIVLTETSGNDIVVVGSSFSGRDMLTIVRTNTSGILLYADYFGIHTAGNPNQVNPYIKGITATYDNGYVLVGSTGHNMDFFGALVIKCDAGYMGAPIHTLNWNYIFRHQLIGGYNLNIPGQRSCTYASGVIEEPSHNLAIVGYSSDNDAMNAGATFENGFILQLTVGGTLIQSYDYPSLTGLYVRFNGLNQDGSNYIITGQATNTGSSQTNTIMAQVDNSTLGVNWSSIYNNGSFNIGCSVFPTPNGYISAGVSNEFSASHQPHVLSVNSSGMAGTCFSPNLLDMVQNTNDIPSYTEDAPIAGLGNNHILTTTDACADLEDMCSSAMAPVKLSSGIFGQPGNIAGKLISIYPNPSAGNINIDLNTMHKSNGTITVMDMQGRVVLSRNVNINSGQNHFDLNISEMNPGIYFIKVIDDKNTMYPVSKITRY
jgi:hypothetical protein